MNILQSLLGRPSQTMVPPTIVHVTHRKAGSQWIYKILASCAPERIVKPYNKLAHFFADPVQPGKIYPTVYATKEEYDSVILPPDTRRFIVIRDLRDTLVSSYFSARYSHRIMRKINVERREKLESVSKEEGLEYLMDTFLLQEAAIQSSWLRCGQELLKFEDLLTRDVELLQATLLGTCGLGLTLEQVRVAVEANRFEQFTGRARGQEDIHHHARKGIAGDWRNHFTKEIKDKFKKRFNDHLVLAGYEKDDNW